MSRRAPIRVARELKSDIDDATRAPADLVDELASELNLLSQTWTDPAAFLERRDLLVKRMRRLARRLGGKPQRDALPRVAAPLATATAGAPTGRREYAVTGWRRATGARPILSLKGSHAARD